MAELEESKPWLIVGLGNPGAAYERTPHNLGFMAVDRLAAVHGIRITRPEGNALVGIGAVERHPAILAKPQTFMNLSGSSIRALLEKYSLAAGRLILVYDELALPWGTLRVRPRGSSAGHNGVESVIRSVGTNEFARVRLGIHPGLEVRDSAEYVLAPMKRALVKELDLLLNEACRAVESIIAEGVEKSMAKFNRRAQGTNNEDQ